MKQVTQVVAMAWLSAWLAAGAAWATEIELTGKKVKDAEAPKVDGMVEKVWDAVRATKVTVSEGPQGTVDLRVKALYTDKDVYLLVQWPDKTMSRSRFYEFDGKEWKKTKGNEDYLALAWDIGNRVKDFPRKGCTVLCHKQDKELVLKTNAPGERIDYWFHKPQRMVPAGQADDQYLTHEVQQDNSKSARRSDPKTGGGYIDNWDKEAKRPKYAFKEGVKPGPALLKQEAVEIKDYGKFKPGDRLPREVLAPFTGSRGDIQAGAVWENGRWSVELKRARLTEDKEHDVQLEGPGPFYFGMAVWDDADDEEHSHTGEGVVKLMLK